MKTNTALAAAAAIGILLASGVSAQEASLSNGASFPPPAQGGMQAYRHASTAAEGRLRGWADLYRAKGEYNYNTASAALIFEHARRANLDNRLRYAEVFWAKKALYDSYQQAQKDQRSRAAVEVQPAAHAVEVAQPEALVDLRQPGFVWPHALHRPEFIPLREQLETLLSQRTPVNSGRGSENYVQLRNATLQTRAALANSIRDLPALEYLEAKQFLDRVLYTAEQPVAVKIAVR